MNPEIFVRYISNQLAENERDALRLQLLADPELSDSFAEWEAERIDALAAGRLSPQDAAQMNEYLRATKQLSRVPIASALSKPKRAAVSPYAIGLALAAMLLLTFPAVRFFQPRVVAPAIVTIPLMPGTLRGEGDVQPVQRPPGRIDLQLQYLDVVPTGQCRVESEGIVVESACGAYAHIFTLPIGLAAGRHRVDLIYNAGSDRFVYFFDLVE